MSTQIIHCAGCFKEIEFEDSEFSLTESLCADCIEQICGSNTSWEGDKEEDES